MSLKACSACTFGIDEADNFCRRCGLAVDDRVTLPATRGNASMTIWKPQASPVVKGAAVMAAGTIGQFVVRRAISSFVGGGSGTKKRRSLFTRKRQDDGLIDEAQIITETVMTRRVRIRRQA
jgi:hypothetical protein